MSKIPHEEVRNIIEYSYDMHMQKDYYKKIKEYVKQQESCDEIIYKFRRRITMIESMISDLGIREEYNKLKRKNKPYQDLIIELNDLVREWIG